MPAISTPNDSTQDVDGGSSSAAETLGNAARNFASFVQSPSSSTLSDPRAAVAAAAEVTREASASLLKAATTAPRFVGIDQRLRESTFYPLGGMSLQDILEKREWTETYSDPGAWTEAVMTYCEGQEVPIPTCDGRTISAFFCPRAHDDSLREREFHLLVERGSENSPVASPSLPPESAVLLLHANAMVGLDMLDYALWYRRQGMHVLAITLGGYGDSEGPISELSTYLDADGALKWLRTQGVPGLPPSRVVVHGLSLGGAVAAGLAEQHPSLHLTLDQTFVNAREVASVVGALAITALTSSSSSSSSEKDDDAAGGFFTPSSDGNGVESAAGSPPPATAAGGSEGDGGGVRNFVRASLSSAATSVSAAFTSAATAATSAAAAATAAARGGREAEGEAPNSSGDPVASSSWSSEQGPEHEHASSPPPPPPDWAVSAVVSTCFPVGLTATGFNHHPRAPALPHSGADDNADDDGTTYTSSSSTREATCSSSSSPSSRRTRRATKRDKKEEEEEKVAPTDATSLSLFAAGLDTDAMLESGALSALVPQYTTDGYDTEQKLARLNAFARANESATPPPPAPPNAQETLDSPSSSSLAPSSASLPLERRPGVGSFFVLSSDGDAMMPESFALRLLAARIGPGPSSTVSTSEPEDEEEETKWGILSGGHGAFFGDQPRASVKYRTHLQELGLVPSSSVLSQAVKQGAALSQRKAAAARTHLLKERTGLLAGSSATGTRPGSDDARTNRKSAKSSASRVPFVEAAF